MRDVIAQQLAEFMDPTTAQMVAALAQMAAMLVARAQQEAGSAPGRPAAQPADRARDAGPLPPDDGLAGAGETPGEESTGHGRGREHGG